MLFQSIALVEAVLLFVCAAVRPWRAAFAPPVARKLQGLAAEARGAALFVSPNCAISPGKTAEARFRVSGLTAPAGQIARARDQGFDVGWRGVYPAVQTEGEKSRAILAIWDCRVPGWRNFEAELVRLGICTREAFATALESLV